MVRAEDAHTEVDEGGAGDLEDFLEDLQQEELLDELLDGNQEEDQPDQPEPASTPQPRPGTAAWDRAQPHEPLFSLNSNSERLSNYEHYRRFAL